jgi:hypothetical protein
MHTKMILASLLTAATLAACSSPTPPITSDELGAQPTLDELNADNDSSLELAGSKNGLGNVLVRKIYDTNQNGKQDEGEPGIPDWGVRIVSVDENGNPDDAADVQVTPQGNQRWRGVNLKVPYGRYKIEELEPTSTKQSGVSWKVTGQASRIVNVSREKSVRAIEFAGVCLENGAVVRFPKIADFGDWKCRATFDLLPRIGSFTATPAQIQSGGSSALAWNVLDYSKLEITPTLGVVTGFTGAKSVSPSSTTAYTLKATNGFGTRTASVTVTLQNTGGVWTNAGNLKLLSGPLSAISLSENRVFFFQETKAELFDFKNGSSNTLNRVPVVNSGEDSWRLMPDQKVFGPTTSDLRSGVVYDPIKDTSQAVNLTAVPEGAFPFVRAPVDAGTLLAELFTPNDQSKVTIGVFDYPSFRYRQTGQISLTRGSYNLGAQLVGLNKDRNAVYFLSGRPNTEEGQIVIVDPKTGKVLSNAVTDLTCLATFFKGSSSAGLGPTVLLPNGHFLRAGGFVDGRNASNTVCDYDPVNNTYRTGSMSQSTIGQPYALSNGQVLILAQGTSAFNNNPYATETQANLYDVNTATSQLSTPFNQARLFQASAQLSDGRIVIAGGNKPRPSTAVFDAPLELLSSIEIYTP